MTDEAIFELTPETSMTAAARFIVQEVAETTRATSATYALMGGLELNTTYDTASDHSNITAAVGTLYAINISAVTTDNLEFDLPDTAKVGERVGVYITTGDDTYELEVRTAAAGSTLNGSDLSASSTKWRLFISNEILICRCIVAGGAGATKWIVEYDGRIPCTAKMNLSTVITTNTAGEVKDVDLDGTISNHVGDIASAANGYVTTRRANSWVVSGYIKPEVQPTDGRYYGIYAEIGSNNMIMVPTVNAASQATFGYVATTINGYTAAGNTIKLKFRAQEADIGCDIAKMQVTEILER